MFESNLFGFPTKSLSEYTVKGPIRLNVENAYNIYISFLKIESTFKDFVYNWYNVDSILTY